MRDRTLSGLAAVGAAALVVHAALGFSLGEGYAIPVTIIGAIAAAVVFRGPVGQALARRIQGESTSELPPETILNELEDLRGRLLELEERVDFSERLLVQDREGAARKDLGGGG